MIYFYVIGSGILAILITFVVILSIGIDMRIAINIDNNFAIADMFILKTIFLFKTKIILHHGDFYMKIGGGVYRRLSYFIKGEKKTKTKDFPKLTLHNVNVRLCIGVADNAITETILSGIAGILLNNLRSIAQNKVKFKGYSEVISPNYTEDSTKLAIDMNIKWSLVKMIKYFASGTKQKEGVIYEN